MKLSTLLCQSFHCHAGRIAIKYQERSWSYKELEAVIDALCSGFSLCGMKAGDRVAFLLPNSPELVFINLACCKLGLVAVPLNVRLTGQELAYNLNHSGARLCIVHESLFSLLEPYRSRLTSVEALFVAGSGAGIASTEPIEALIDKSQPFTP